MEVTSAEVRTLLARAYRCDPLMTWVFPQEEHRLEAAAAWLGVAVERYLARGEVDVVRDDGLAAVALWRLPETSLDGPETLPTARGVLRAVVGAEHAAAVARGFALAREQAPVPAHPHAYLHFLAVAPGSQRRGLGGRLLDDVLSRTRSLGVPLRLETTNPANVPFYEAHGLRVRAEARLGDTGPVLWALDSGSGSMVR